MITPRVASVGGWVGALPDFLDSADRALAVPEAVADPIGSVGTTVGVVLIVSEGPVVPSGAA